jgi:hypothetical protein
MLAAVLRRCRAERPAVLAPVFALSTPAIDFDDFLSVDATRALFDRMRCVMWVNCLSLPGVSLGNGLGAVTVA